MSAASEGSLILGPSFPEPKKRSHGAYPQFWQQSRAARPSRRSQARLPVPTSSPRPARHSRPRLSSAAKGHLCPRLFLAPSQVSQRTTAACNEPAVLDIEAQCQREARCLKHGSTSQFGMGGTHHLGVRSAGRGRSNVHPPRFPRRLASPPLSALFPLAASNVRMRRAWCSANFGGKAFPISCAAG
jgi:hypothetical protein